jgi:hypothetical protein
VRTVPAGRCLTWTTTWNATTDDGTPVDPGHYFVVPRSTATDPTGATGSSAVGTCLWGTVDVPGPGPREGKAESGAASC